MANLPRSFATICKHYLLGLLAAAWNGGIGAVAGILGIDAASMTGAVNDIHTLNWHEMLAVFVGAFAIHGIFWLKSHPLPESFDTEAPFSLSTKPPGTP